MSLSDNIRMGANIYIGLVGLDRFDDQRFKNEELNQWIQDNVDILNCTYVKYSRKKSGQYMAGIYLTSEQATIFKLMFAL